MKSISAKKLKKLGGKMPFSSITAPKKKIRSANPEATKKRRARNAKRMRGKEYQDARAGAMERAEGMCEFIGGESWCGDYLIRCAATENLQFHEEHYARGRILTMDDGKIYCRFHHHLVEKQKPHKWHKTRMF